MQADVSEIKKRIKSLQRVVQLWLLPSAANLARILQQEGDDEDEDDDEDDDDDDEDDDDGESRF